MDLRVALTFDDVLLVPKRSSIKSRKEVDIKAKFSKNISLNIPLVSANMDSVTESAMGIAMAREGGLGLIHQFMSVEKQVEEVKKVKRSESLLIEKPYTLKQDQTLQDIWNLTEEKGVSSFPVIDNHNKLLGLITSRDTRFEKDSWKKVGELMVKVSDIVTAPIGTGVEEAREIMKKNRIGKLPLIDSNGLLKGLITGTDILKSERGPQAVKDNRGRLLAAAAIGVRRGFLERVKALLDAECDVICVDIAHGHSDLEINAVKDIRKHFGNVELIAGNIATGKAAEDLISAGVDGVKIGVGPGCFAAGTRILMSNGIYKNIENVNPGDKVINRDGKPVIVLRSFSTGIRRVHSIRSSIFYQETHVTPDHRYWVGDLNSTSISTIQSRGYAPLLEVQSKTIPKDSKYKWKHIQDLKQDVLLMPKNIEFELDEDFEIDLKKCIGGNWRVGFDYKTDVKLAPNYELGYIIGTFLGDGSAYTGRNSKNSKIGSVRWYFGSNELGIAHKLMGCIKRVFKKDCKIYFRKKIIQVIFYYKPLADFLKSFGKKDGKCLPAKYLVNNKEYLNGLLDGLVDSDGNQEPGGRIRFTNTSKRLIELFGILCYLVKGFFPNSAEREISIGGLNGANIENFNVSYRSDIINTGEKRLTKKYQVAKLLDLEETNVEVKVYDLEVDCPTHSFIANNAIVHNSTCITRIVTGSGVPQLTAIMDVSKVCKQYDIPAIADGGMRTSGDLVKALAAGASCGFSGHFFAGTEEAPGITINRNGRRYKIYRGSASFGAALTRKEREKTEDLDPFDYTPEGREAMVPYRGTVSEVVKQLIGGLRSGISYCGSKNIKEMQANAEFIRVTPIGVKESGDHDVQTV